MRAHVAERGRPAVASRSAVAIAAAGPRDHSSARMRTTSAMSAISVLPTWWAAFAASSASCSASLSCPWRTRSWVVTTSR